MCVQGTACGTPAIAAGSQLDWTPEPRQRQHLTVATSKAERPSQCACRNLVQGPRSPTPLRVRRRLRGCQDPLHRGPKKSCGRGPRARRGSASRFTADCRSHPDHAPATSCRVIGRPRRRRALPSYFLAISLRYQRRIWGDHRDLRQDPGRVCDRAQRVDDAGRTSRSGRRPSVLGGRDSPHRR